MKKKFRAILGRLTFRIERSCERNIAGDERSQRIDFHLHAAEKSALHIRAAFDPELRSCFDEHAVSPANECADVNLRRVLTELNIFDRADLNAAKIDRR